MDLDALLRTISRPGALDAMLHREGQPGGALHRMHVVDGSIEASLRPIPEGHERTRPMSIPELADLMGQSPRRDRFGAEFIFNGRLACELYDRTLGGPVRPDQPGRQIRLFRFDADQLLGRYADNGNGGRPYIDQQDEAKLFWPRH
ncbi:MAG: hypothetical protein EDM74_13455 [Armatimonadetes bacterium]|nr:MAG: hypothetical protein EDM74_13455 [Armatimonadota bacterium]